MSLWIPYYWQSPHIWVCEYHITDSHLRYESGNTILLTVTSHMSLWIHTISLTVTSHISLLIPSHWQSPHTLVCEYHLTDSHHTYESVNTTSLTVTSHISLWITPHWQSPHVWEYHLTSKWEEGGEEKGKEEGEGWRMYEASQSCPWRIFK